MPTRTIVQDLCDVCFEEQNGKEKQPTFHQTKNIEKPFHIDYIFLPRDWGSRIKGLEVGHHAQWLKHSDHCPVTVELRDEP